MTDATGETVTITYQTNQGDTTTFTEVTDYTNDGKFIRFKGKKSGESAVVTWEINCSIVASVRREGA